MMTKMTMTMQERIIKQTRYNDLDDEDDEDDDDDDRVGPARSILLKTLYAGLSWNFLNCDRAFGWKCIPMMLSCTIVISNCTGTRWADVIAPLALNCTTPLDFNLWNPLITSFAFYWKIVYFKSQMIERTLQVLWIYHQNAVAGPRLPPYTTAKWVLKVS